MAKSIKNRVFGSDISSIIKAKIELRQAFAESSNPNEQIEKIFEKYEDVTTSDLNINDISPNFKGLADLSSRTPFVRMWTALELFDSESWVE